MFWKVESRESYLFLFAVGWKYLPPPISFKQNQSVQCLSIKRTCAFIHLPMTSRKDHPYKKTVCSSKADCQPNYTQNISKYGQTGRNPVRCTSLWLKPNYLLNLCSSLIYNPLFNLYYNIFLLYYYYTHLRLLIIWLALMYLPFSAKKKSICL